MSIPEARKLAGGASLSCLLCCLEQDIPCVECIVEAAAARDAELERPDPEAGA